LLHSVARNHALVDGNKRLALLAAVVFLELNGFVIDMPDDDVFELVMDVARGVIEVEAIAERMVLAPRA
jgi:death-on-curing protein